MQKVFIDGTRHHRHPYCLSIKSSSSSISSPRGIQVKKKYLPQYFTIVFLRFDSTLRPSRGFVLLLPPIFEKQDFPPFFFLFLFQTPAPFRLKWQRNWSPKTFCQASFYGYAFPLSPVTIKSAVQLDFLLCTFYLP